MTPEKPDRFIQVTVTLERRDDGGLRAYSDDVPGFVLSHREPKLVLADIVPALEVILSSMFNRPVHAGRLVDMRQALDDNAADTASVVDETAVPAAHLCAEYVAYCG